MKNADDYLKLAKELFTEKFGNALCAFAAGSLFRGEGTPTSDIDFVVIFSTSKLPQAYRDSLKYNDVMFECFVQNENSLEFFINEDFNSGIPILPHMIINGIPLPEENDYTHELQRRVKDRYDNGPKQLTRDEINVKRYFITDLLLDMEGCTGKEESTAILIRLYEIIGDFYLRVNKQWSGSGKSLFRAINNYDPFFAQEYSNVFTNAFSTNNYSAVIQFGNKVLEPYGGRFWEGFKQLAPEEANKYTSA